MPPLGDSVPPQTTPFSGPVTDCVTDWIGPFAARRLVEVVYQPSREIVATYRFVRGPDTVDVMAPGNLGVRADIFTVPPDHPVEHDHGLEDSGFVGVAHALTAHGRSTGATLAAGSELRKPLEPVGC